MSDFRLQDLVPSEVVAPASAEELALVLRDASAQGRAVVPWGVGTRQHIGRLPLRYELALSTLNLNRIIEHVPADLVVTVEAGARLKEVQEALVAHGQWLPWDPPGADQATIGGLLASGASGPLRLGYGAPRDWTLGMRVALGDGRLVKSGARVVKNVAGYDTHKLHLGALGTLGVIVEVTFKLAPLPARTQTLLATFADPRHGMQALALLADPPLRPIALLALSQGAASTLPALAGSDVGTPDALTVVARFGGVPTAVGRQMREGARRCAELDARCIDLSQQDEQLFWKTIADLNLPAGDGSLLLRAGIRPAEMMHLAFGLEQAPRQRGWTSQQLLLGGLGLGFARWHLPAGVTAETVAAALAEQRAALTRYGGYCVVEEVPQGMALDIWGPPPPTIELMRSLRAAWDPAQVLNPGRYLV